MKTEPPLKLALTAPITSMFFNKLLAQFKINTIYLNIYRRRRIMVVSSELSDSFKIVFLLGF